MAYNGMFPISYQQPYLTQYNQQNNGIVWVQGEAGAKSFMVAPNHTVDLWDSESQTIYLKSADASGMPSMKILDYTVREQNNQPASSLMQSPEYVTHDELSTFEDKILKLIKGGGENVESNI